MGAESRFTPESSAPSDDEIKDALIAFEAAVYEDNSDEESIEPARNALLGVLVRCREAARATRSESERSVLVKKVEAFATLPDNWNSYGSKKFPPRTILLAREIAAKLGPEWSAVPCADGPSVWLTRDNENDILEIRTSDDE